VAGESSESAAHGEAEGGDGAARRRRSFGRNWRAIGGRRVRVSNGEACTGVDWGGRCLVVAAHCGRTNLNYTSSSTRVLNERATSHFKRYKTIGLSGNVPMNHRT
jgi:hypothetical protein